MPTFRHHPNDLLYSLAADLSLWQTLVFNVWVFILLLRKCKGALSFFLWRWFDKLSCSFATPGPSEASSDAELIDYADDVPDHYLYGGRFEDKPPLERLIPAFPDSLVEGELWLLLAQSPVALLQLRGLNWRWKSFIDETVEWRAIYSIFLQPPRLGASADGDELIAHRLGLEVAERRNVIAMNRDLY